MEVRVVPEMRLIAPTVASSQLRVGPLLEKLREHGMAPVGAIRRSSGTTRTAISSKAGSSLRRYARRRSIAYCLQCFADDFTGGLHCVEFARGTSGDCFEDILQIL